MAKHGCIVYLAPDEAVARFERAQRRLREAVASEQKGAGQKAELDLSWQALARTRPLAARQHDVPPPAPMTRGAQDADAEGNTGAFAQAAKALRTLDAASAVDNTAQGAVPGGLRRARGPGARKSGR